MKKNLFVYYLLPLLLGASIVVAESAGGSALRRKPPVTNRSTSTVGRNPTALLPGHIEAETYSAMQGIQLEPTADQDGGQNITSIDDGDWMDYNVNVASTGVYTFRFRVANGWGDGAEFELRQADGTPLKSVQIPRTGGLQSWQTLTATVRLTAGEQTLRLFVVKGNWNLNWLEAAPGRSLPGKLEAESFDVATDVRFEPTSDEGGGQNVNYIDDGDWMDYNVTVATAGPYTFAFRVANSYGNGVIYVKAEDGSTLASVSVPRTGGWQNWTTISTTATLPAGSQVLRIYTNPGTWNFNWFEVKPSGAPLPGHIEAETYSAMQGIQLESTADQNGGQNITGIDDGDWMDYNVNVASTGVYTFRFRVANGWGDGAAFELRQADGTPLKSVQIPRTGGLQSWQTLTATVRLTAGEQTLRLFVVKGNWNLNWLEAAPGRSLPGKLEAESFDVATDVRFEPTSDEGGGQNVNYIDDGDWMDYNVNVATAGPYTFAFRVANSYGNGVIYVKAEDGSTLASVSVPRTGGWQNWTTIRTTATLPAGSQVLRVYTNPGTWNFNWFEVNAGGRSAESGDDNVRRVTRQNSWRDRFYAGGYQYQYRHTHHVHVVQSFGCYGVWCQWCLEGIPCWGRNGGHHRSPGGFGFVSGGHRCSTNPNGDGSGGSSDGAENTA